MSANCSKQCGSGWLWTCDNSQYTSTRWNRATTEIGGQGRWYCNGWTGAGVWRTIPMRLGHGARRHPQPTDIATPINDRKRRRELFG